jgi:glutaminyl-peptide cyclotransferase
MIKRFLYTIILGLFFVGCNGSDPTVVEDPNPTIKDVQLIAPSNQDQFVIGDPLLVKIEVNHPDLIDDLQLYVDDTIHTGKLVLKSQDITVDTKRGRVGYVPVFIEYSDGEGKLHRDNRTITFFSDIQPATHEVEVIVEYPHKAKSYTQGLEFYEGKLYEGTGQKGSSVLAEVDLKSGKHIRKVKLPNEIFGEGITILNDTVYQISYQAGKCFVYDVNTFEKLTEFSYVGEGWGMCNNGESILMSNGSSEIVWRNPRTFEVTKKLDVFDDQSNVPQLNELELIDGYLYANIYMDSRICKIDTATGKILSYYNLSPMVNAQGEGVDVLNGICQNKGKVYVTGKWWKNLYEISFE